MSNLREQIEIMSAGAQGGFGPLYYHVLPKLINEFNLKVGVEVGVCLGGHSEAMLLHTKMERLYSVDPYVYAQGSTDGHVLPTGKGFDQPEYDEMYEYTKERLSVFGTRNIFIRKTSLDAASEVNEPLDICFIDAIHKYSNVREDIALWGSKVRQGGIIAGHDFNHPNFPGVTQAVGEFALGKILNVEDGYVWWVQK
jgi:hypothetical protein